MTRRPSLRLVRDPHTSLLDMLTHMYPAWDIALEKGLWRAVSRQPCNCPQSICYNSAADLAHALGEFDLQCRPSA